MTLTYELPPVTRKPLWLTRAHSNLGVREWAGEKHNPVIVQWWKDIRASFRDDETPYCAAFVGAMLERSGVRSTRKANARSYADPAWGVKLARPVVGCIVVLWRHNPKSWSGHVGFLIGFDEKGNMLILGANQDNEVKISAFPCKRLVGCFWPREHGWFEYSMPKIIAGTHATSKTEA
jgi:uncharacterized protein (TIGR02594 family)